MGRGNLLIPAGLHFVAAPFSGAAPPQLPVLAPVGAALPLKLGAALPTGPLGVAVHQMVTRWSASSQSWSSGPTSKAS